MRSGFRQMVDKLAEVHRVFAEDAGVDTLIEVDAPLHRNAARLSLAPDETQVPDLSNDLLEARAGDDVVVHQDQVLLGPVQRLDVSHDRRDGF